MELSHFQGRRGVNAGESGGGSGNSVVTGVKGNK